LKLLNVVSVEAVECSMRKEMKGDAGAGNSEALS
jgi:hypothetical protein